ncbi:hypothetical protein EC988_008169 [Linderina pennispora]|nr:hypothetical protein EC988_008169 [Linderina pennispora]
MSHNSSPVGIAPVSSPDPYAPHYQTHQVQPRQVSPYQVPHQHQMVPPQYQMPPHQMQMPPQMQPMHTLTRAPLPHHQADVREIPIDLHQRHSAHYAQPSRIHPYMQHPTMHQMVHGQESVMAFHTSVNVPQERYVFAPLNTGNMTHPYPPSYYPEEAPQKQDGVMNFYHGKRSRGPANRWQPEEDELLKKAVEKWGDERQWVKVSKMVPGRTNLQCRQRWLCNLKGKIMAAKLKAEAAEKNAALLAAATATANAAAVASSSKVAEPAAETMAVDGAEQDDQDKEME